MSTPAQASSAGRPSTASKVPIAPARDSHDGSPTIITRLTRPSSHSLHELLGRNLAHFELLELIGSGGMATVIKARDLVLSRIVALKVLPPDMASDPENIVRFHQEARAAAKLDDNHIARVWYCGEDQGLHFIAFEFIEGENLRIRMDRAGGRLSTAESVPYLIQVAMGLTHALSRGVIHRDVKPSNIIITPQGHACIVDLGLARSIDAHSVGGVTHSGITLGTFDYISPEQAIDPRQADIRSDIYSLGCTFYHVLTGQLPVPEGTPARKLHYHRDILPIDPRELVPDLSDEMATILGKMMAKDPAVRYQTPDSLIADLIRFARKANIATETQPPAVGTPTPVEVAPRRPVAADSTGLLWVFGISGIALVVGLLLAGQSGDTPDPLPLWAVDKPAIESRPAAPSTVVDPGTESPVGRGEVRAANVAELLEALRQPETRAISLTGAVYDLTTANEGGLLVPPSALFEGAKIAIVGADARAFPLIRLLANPCREARTERPGSLSFRGSAETGVQEVSLANLRIEVASARADLEYPASEQAAILAEGRFRLTIRNCSMSMIPSAESHDPVDVPGLVLGCGSTRDSASSIRIGSCAIAGVSSAVQLRGNTGLELDDVLMMPTGSAAIRCDRAGGEAPAKPASIRATHCTILLREGVFVDAGGPATVSVERSVLARTPDDAPTPASLLRGMNIEYRGKSNGWSGVRLSRRDGFPDATASMLPDTEVDSRQVSVTFRSADPLDPGRLPKSEDLAKFAVPLNVEALRVGPTDPTPLGISRLPGQTLYPSPIPPVSREGRLEPGQKVFDPGLSEDRPLPAGVYRDFRKAMLDARPGDEILIRSNGILSIQPEDLGAGDLPAKLTIRADAGYRPVLTTAPGVRPAMFRVYAGELTLSGLQIRLRAGNGNGIRMLASIPGAGRVTLKNCAISLDAPSGRCAVFGLADSASEMMSGPVEDKPGQPRLVLENTLIRGRGRTVLAPSGRAFDLEMTNCLTALEGSFAEIGPMPTGTPGGGTIRLERSTFWLTDQLLLMTAAKRMDNRGFALPRLDITSVDCLFVPASNPPTPLIRGEKIDNRTQLEEQKVISWKDSKGNLYGFPRDGTILDLVPEDADTMPGMRRLDGDEWLRFSRESGTPFAEVRFAIQPPPGKAPTNIQASDFRIRSLLPPAKADDPVPGCRTDLLPRDLRAEE